MNRKNDTRLAILRGAQDLIQRRSISGVSFQDLAKRVGIKKGSMYYHFETKDELAVEMLNRASENLNRGIEDEHALSPSQRLSNLLQFYGRQVCEQNKLCPGGVFASEWDSLSEPVQAAAQKVFETLTKGIENIVRDGLEAGEFDNHNKSVETLTSFVVWSIQGGLVTSRIEESSEPYYAASDFVLDYLGAKNP